MTHEDIQNVNRWNNFGYPQGLIQKLSTIDYVLRTIAGYSATQHTHRHIHIYIYPTKVFLMMAPVTPVRRERDQFDGPRKQISEWYPLVNSHITMENHHAIYGEINYFYGHFQQLFWHNQRVNDPEQLENWFNHGIQKTGSVHILETVWWKFSFFMLVGIFHPVIKLGKVEHLPSPMAMAMSGS